MFKVYWCMDNTAIRDVYAVQIDPKTQKTMFLVYYVHWTWVDAEEYKPL